MDLTQDVEPVTALKRGASDLIARATARQGPIVITQHGKPTAVLQDVASYERQQRTLLLLRLLAAGEQDVVDGRLLDTDDVFALMETQIGDAVS